MLPKILSPAIWVSVILAMILTAPLAALADDNEAGAIKEGAAKEKKGAAAEGDAASRSEVERLRDEVQQLRALVETLVKERRAAADQASQSTSPLSTGAVASAEAKATTAARQAERPQAQKPHGGQEPQEKQIPGRGQTDQGLYGTGAAGGQGTRYARSVFGDSVRIGGYGSFRFETNNLDRLQRVGNLPVARHNSNGFDIRRLVLTADVTPVDRLRFYTELELERFGKIEIERTAIPENRGGQSNLAGTRFIQELEGQDGSEIKLEQFWVQYDLTKNLAVRGGIILPPLGRFNILHDDDYWDIPRRTLIDRDAPALPVKSAWSEAGVGLIGSKPVGKGFINYQFYVVNGVALDFALEQVVAVRDDKTKIEFEPEIGFDSGPVNGSRPANAVTWRLGLSPRVGNEIAFSGYHGKYTPKFLQTSAYINSLGVDGKFTVGNFEGEGEFIYTKFGKMQRVLNDIARNLVNSSTEDELNETETEVEVGLKGPFTDHRHGFWVDLKYRWRPGWLKQSLLGEGFSDPQLIPIIRYERVWYNKLVREFSFRQGVGGDLDLENLSQDRVTVGLTYRPVSSVPISFAYQRNQRRGGSTLLFPDTLGLGRAVDRSFGAFMIGVALGF